MREVNDGGAEYGTLFPEGPGAEAGPVERAEARMTTPRMAGLGAGLILTPPAAWAQAGDYGYHGMHGGFGWGMMGSGIGTLLVILIIAGLVAVVLLATRWQPGGERRPGRDDPLSVLSDRYARGEIDSEEFEERRKKLRE